LLFDVILQAHRFDAFDIAGTRAEAEAVQDVHDTLFLGQHWGFRTLLCGDWNDRLRRDYER
jgi:hypothetical protein